MKLKWDPERYFKAHVQLDDVIVWNRNYELYNHFFFSATFRLSSSLVLNAKLHLTHFLVVALPIFTYPAQNYLCHYAQKEI